MSGLPFCPTAAQPGSLKLMLASAAGRRRWLHRAVAIVKIYVVMLALAGVIRCDALLAQFHSGRRCSVSFLGGMGKGNPLYSENNRLIETE